VCTLDQSPVCRSYLDSGHFSHNSLKDQLTSEYGAQFTKAQAAQAVKSVGL
jgi:host cell surface-exposed lipoprotein